MDPVWRPSSERIKAAGITRYLRWLAARRGLRFDGYESLWRWSTAQIEEFWASIWDFCGVIAHSPYQRVLDRRAMPGVSKRRGMIPLTMKIVQILAKVADNLSRTCAKFTAPNQSRLQRPLLA